MPAFTFEKISPPTNRGPVAPIEKKQRGVITQMMDRLIEARAKRNTRASKRNGTRRTDKPG